MEKSKSYVDVACEVADAMVSGRQSQRMCLEGFAPLYDTWEEEQANIDENFFKQPYVGFFVEED